MCEPESVSDSVCESESVCECESDSGSESEYEYEPESKSGQDAECKSQVHACITQGGLELGISQSHSQVKSENMFTQYVTIHECRYCVNAYSGRSEWVLPASAQLWGS